MPVSNDAILNLTQHSATAEQVRDGVVPLPEAGRAELQQLLNFDEIPSRQEIGARAARLAELAAESGCRYAMLGGAPFLISVLEEQLRRGGITPLYAFSLREVEEQQTAEGVRKTTIFRHLGFVGKEEE